MKSFITRPITVSIVLFLLINLVVIGQFRMPSAIELIRARGENIPMARTFTGWTARAYADLKQAPDIVLFGSSQMGTAVFSGDADKLDQALDTVKHRTCAQLQDDLKERLGKDVTVFNWALGGSMVSDAYFESLALFTGEHKPRMVVIGVNPRDFIDNSLNSASATEQFHFFTRYADPGKLVNVAVPSFMGRFEWAFNKTIPLRRVGMDIQGVYLAGDNSEEEPETKGGTQPLQAVSMTGKRVKEGQWVVPAHIPADVFVDNTKEYQNRYANPFPKLYKAELRFFNEFLALMNQRGIEVLVVGMPSLWPNRKLLPEEFWTDWRSKVAAACKEHNVEWLDLTASAEFNSGHFLDMVHMNARGGNKLFELITAKIASDRRMVACLERPTPVAGLKPEPTH